MKPRAKKILSRNVSYSEERDPEPSKQTGDVISERNNNSNAADPLPEGKENLIANDKKIGDAGGNRRKQTKFRSNRSMDA